MLEVEKALNAFTKAVIKQSRTNLTKMRIKDKGDLYNKIKANYKVSKNSFELDFSFPIYGQFQDKGVKGVGGVRRSTSKYNSRNNKGKMWKQKAPKSPFSFKPDPDRKPSVKHFKQWANKRGLSPYAVREVVYHQGIKPRPWFTKAFENEFKKHLPIFQDKFGLDMQQLINYSLRDL
jgi:hypothetical protein